MGNERTFYRRGYYTPSFQTGEGEMRHDQNATLLSSVRDDFLNLHWSQTLSHAYLVVTAWPQGVL